jgi:tryptophan 2,3-dioxygenase
MTLSEELLSKIQQLQEKFASENQDLLGYLDGLLHADYLTYWDYIHLDTLLSLQNPRTAIEDEPIFIMYHQITELYFKLSLMEFANMRKAGSGQDAAALLQRVQRINRYFEALTTSFGVMEKGMDREQFLKFRMTLMPASGFQSAQYRMIEIAATPLRNLVGIAHRAALQDETAIEKLFEKIYWKAGATIEESGEKTLTLKQFERKYTAQLLQMAHEVAGQTLGDYFHQLPAPAQADPKLVNALKLLDLNVNVYWPLQHYKTAVAYLAKRPHDIAATGGTNWQKYLPPRFQKRIFFPELWTANEQDEWGKPWVDAVLKSLQADE